MNRWRFAAAVLALSAAAAYSTSPVPTPGEAGAAVTAQGKPSMVLDRVREVRVGEPQFFSNMAVFPLVGRSISGLQYLTLDEAMSQGAIRVSEKGQGQVNLIVINSRSDSRVFIMDGEEIVGAKQNRIINSSLMIGPRQVADVPASCVEQGRWTRVSELFKAGGTQLFAKARQTNLASVSGSLAARPSAGAQSDQSAIWGKVAEKRAALSMSVPSGPMHEAYQKYDQEIEKFTRGFKTVPNQVGAIFAINGNVVGADVFDQNRTLNKLFPKLVKSYALDAIESGDASVKHPSSHEARRFLQLALQPKVSLRDYRSPGEGLDVRITSDRITGAGLVTSGRAVHICLFAANDAPAPMKHVRPASERRRSLPALDL